MDALMARVWEGGGGGHLICVTPRLPDSRFLQFQEEPPEKNTNLEDYTETAKDLFSLCRPRRN